MLPDLDVRLQRHAAQLDAMAPVIDLPEVRSVAAATPAGDLRVPVRISHRKAVIALAILALGLIAAAVGYSLRSETVEQGGAIGKFLEMEIAPDGLPFLVYSDADSGGTVLAKCADRFCAEDTTLTRFDGFFPSILMRDDSRPLIWMDGPDGSGLGPWLLDCQNASCSEYTQSDAASMPSQPAAISPAGHALYAYWDDADKLVIGTCEDAACSNGISETTVTNSLYVDLYEASFDAAGHPSVLFVDQSAEPQLRLVRCLAPDCSTGYSDSVIASTRELEELRPFATVIDDAGLPWIVHDRYGPQIIRCRDTACDVTDTVPLGIDERAWAIDALIGPDGLPIFVYNWSEDERTMVLKVGRCRDETCATGTVATIHEGSLVSSFSATLDRAGFPVVGYRTEEGVVASTCGDPGCTNGALNVATWDHTEAKPATTSPPITAPPTTLFEPPPDEPVVVPAFEPGQWIRIADYADVFDCNWEPTENPEIQECRTVLPEGSGSPSHLRFADMANLSGTLVVITEACSFADECTDPHTTAWTSRDGLTWTPSLIAETGWVEWLVTGGPGLLAVGETCDDDGCRPASWTSPDGVTWLASPPSTLPDCTGLESNFQCITGVVGGADHYVMYGHSVDDEAVWASSDGITWRAADLKVDDGYVPFGHAVWTLENRLVALVNVCGPLTEEESQGLLWEEVRSQSMYYWYLSAYGEFWTSCSRSLWVSEDGIVWTGSPTETFGRTTYWNVPISWDGGALLVGEYCEDQYTCGSRAFVSSDGVTWESRELEGLLERPAGAVLVTSQGLVSAGFVFDELGTGTWRSLVSTSEDGLVWSTTEFGFPELNITAPYSDGVVGIYNGLGDSPDPSLAGIWTWRPES